MRRLGESSRERIKNSWFEYWEALKAQRQSILAVFPYIRIITQQPFIFSERDPSSHDGFNIRLWPRDLRTMREPLSGIQGVRAASIFVSGHVIFAPCESPLSGIQGVRALVPPE